jgi:1-acyl-sn-glycerol-3-phosphate acyltransferase
MPERRAVAWIRLLATAPVILGSGVLLALGSASLALAPRARRRFRVGLFGATARALLALLRAEVKVSGSPPRPPFLLATNHLGYVDILVLASRLPVRFVAKAEVRRWPLLGPICKGFGTIFIDRTDRREIPRVLAEIEAALARGEGVIVFPEGTSSSGEEVLPFRSPLLALPARRGLPVHAAALSYNPPDVAWWGDAALLPHLIGLFRLPRIEAMIDFAAEPVVDGDRKRLAGRLREVVAARRETSPERPAMREDWSDLSAAETPRRCTSSERRRTSSGASLRDVGGVAEDGGYGSFVEISLHMPP